MHCIRPLFGCVRNYCLPNNVLQKNLKVLTICGHGLFNEKGLDSFSSSSMMISNSSFVCSHGHSRLIYKGFCFNNEYKGNQPHLDFSSIFLTCWS
jgi:hypothetical protein